MFDNLAGREFGNVIVTEQFKRQRNGGTKWLVECRCPARTRWWVWAELIKRQPSICCRECRNEVISLRQKQKILRFGDQTVWPGGSPERKAYRAWQGCRQRCFNPKATGWERYGGRGITVCDGFNRNYRTFLKIVGLPPLPDWSLGRKDNDGNYSCGKCAQCRKNCWPLNVQWENLERQNNNRSRNRFITIGGRTMTAVQWSVRAGISAYTFMHRLKRGVPVDKLLYESKIDNSMPLFYAFNC